MNHPSASAIEQARAFPAYACPERYFASSASEQARRSVEECVRRGDGPALVIAAPGMGKTMLVEVLSSAFADRFGVVALTSSQLCTRRALLQAILFGLELPYREREEGELRLSLMQALRNHHELPRGIVLLVDEAQLLTPRLLEELRVLSNLARHGEPIVRLVLAGGPALEETFASPELEAFNQRIGARCYLGALTYEETRDYVRSHVAAVGADPDEVFTPEGLDAVFLASDGVPRLINQVCDRALRAAVADSLLQVDAQVIQRAWSDLHQLPAPWSASPRPAAARRAEEPVESVVEFGELEELGDQPTNALTPAATEIPAPVVAPVVRPPVWNADEALGITQPIERAIRSAESGADDDPFGDDFQEEEIVIDRFSGLEEAFQPTTPVVSNALDPKLSTMAGTLLRDDATGPVDESILVGEPIDDAGEADELDADDEPTPRSIRLQRKEIDLLTDEGEHDERSPSTLMIDSSGEDDILIIENETIEVEGIKLPMARRQEYRQLFAKLRHG